MSVSISEVRQQQAVPRVIHPAAGFAAEVDAIGRGDWSELIAQFDDGAVYQTWTYETVRWGERRMSHLVLKREGRPVAAAQLRIVRAPLMGFGIAYLFRGPVWRLRSGEPDPEILRQMLRALRSEYAGKRGLLLRVLPNEIDPGDGVLRSMFEGEGYVPRPEVKPQRTFVLDLAPDLEVLRKTLKHNWRNNLNKAEAQDFEIAAGTSDDLYDAFVTLYREMHARKQFTEHVDVDEFGEIQRRLPDPFKMEILACYLDGKPVAAGACSIMGATGIQVFLATGEAALRTQAAYRLFWTQIQRLKARGIRFYDLGGIDPDANPGGYRFKAGLSGRDCQFLGEFECCESPWSRLSVKAAERCRQAAHDSRKWVAQRLSVRNHESSSGQ